MKNKYLLQKFIFLFTFAPEFLKELFTKKCFIMTDDPYPSCSKTKVSTLL